MGNQQPKKLGKASKAQIDMASLKAKIHLQIMRDRKNNDIIKGEKQLLARIKAKSRNKTQEILIAERVVNGLKYAQACNQLMAYAVSIRGSAAFLSENMNNPAKLAPFLTQIYSLIYAAETMGLSSLNQFKALMKALNDPIAVGNHVNPEIFQLLKPTPTPEELNMYMIEMADRNNLEIEEINAAGHKFTRDFNPIPDPSSKGNSFADLEKQLAEQMKNQLNLSPKDGPGQGGYNPNQGQGGKGSFGLNQGPGGFGPNQGGQGGYNPNQGQGGFGSNPNQGGYSGNPGGYGQGGIGSYGQGGYGNPNVPGGQGPNYYNLDKGIIPSRSGLSSQESNPYGFRESLDPKSNPTDSNPSQPKDRDVNNSRMSILSIDDIEYFPELDPHPLIAKDPDFDKICDILRAAM